MVGMPILINHNKIKNLKLRSTKNNEMKDQF